MLPEIFSNASFSENASASSGMTRIDDFNYLNCIVHASPPQQPKKRRNLPGNPEPDSEVIALSPRSLMATNRFVCEVCCKGFQRDQNLQLHRRGHNLPWKLSKRNNAEFKKKVYVCPEPSCVHHNPSRALGDLTGIKKHFCRKHREKRLRCQKCSKMYAVESDYKAHSKVCGTKETRCECGRVFSRKDKYETHKPFCDALAYVTGRVHTSPIVPTYYSSHQNQLNPLPTLFVSNKNKNQNQDHDPKHNTSHDFSQVTQEQTLNITSPLFQVHTTPLLPPPHQLGFLEQQNSTPTNTNTAYMSAPEIIQQAANVSSGSNVSSAAHTKSVDHIASCMVQTNMNHFDHEVSQIGIGNSDAHGISGDHMGFSSDRLATWQRTSRCTRDFLGLGEEGGGDGIGGTNFNSTKDIISFSGAICCGTYDQDHLILMRTPGFSFGDTWIGEYLS